MDRLALQVKNGDETAFKSIFDLFNKRLLYMAKEIVPDPALAEDIVQDAFIKLWDRRKNFNDIMSIKAFLYLCVKNSCRNEYKHAKVVDKYLSRQQMPVEEHIVVSKMIEAEVFNELHKAIEKLPNGCKDVIYLGYFAEMSNQEVADELNISINTVKTQKLRALRSLRTFLRDLSPGLLLLVTEICYKWM